MDRAGPQITARHRRRRQTHPQRPSSGHPDPTRGNGPHRFGLLAIDTRINCEFIGYCGLIEGRATIDGPEIAFELFRRARGQGYATEASEAVVAAAAETGRARLWSTVRARNVPSLRVLDKLRFVRSGKVEADVDRGNLLWLTRTLVAADVAPPVR